MKKKRWKKASFTLAIPLNANSVTKNKNYRKAMEKWITVHHW